MADLEYTENLVRNLRRTETQMADKENIKTETIEISHSSHTIQCKHCGDSNDIGNAICANCMTPLTAFGGQVGQANNFDSQLTAQLAALDERPPVIAVMTVFSVLFALVVPIWSVIKAWRVQPHVNEDGTNGIQAATGILVPLFQTVILLPIAIALCTIAYFTWTQRPWAWTANVVILGLITLIVVVLYGLSLPTFFWLTVAGVVAYLWYRQPVKAWFALG